MKNVFKATLVMIFFISLNSFAFAQKQKTKADIEEKSKIIEDIKKGNITPPKPSQNKTDSEPVKTNSGKDSSSNSNRNKQSETEDSYSPNSENSSAKSEKKRKHKKRKKKRKKRRYKNKDIYILEENEAEQDSEPFDYEVRVMLRRFNFNDIIMSKYNATKYVEKTPQNYLPYFDQNLKGKYKPLYKIYFTVFSLGYGFLFDNWHVYYEPDLKNIFIDKKEFGKIKYERLVLTPVGKTIKKVNKKFRFKSNSIRPVLVEDISVLDNQRIHSFSVKKLPRGVYELKLISKNGDILKHQFNL